MAREPCAASGLRPGWGVGVRRCISPLGSAASADSRASWSARAAASTVTRCSGVGFGKGKGLDGGGGRVPRTVFEGCSLPKRPQLVHARVKDAKGEVVVAGKDDELAVWNRLAVQEDEKSVLCDRGVAMKRFGGASAERSAGRGSTWTHQRLRYASRRFLSRSGFTCCFRYSKGASKSAAFSSLMSTPTPMIHMPRGRRFLPSGFDERASPWRPSPRREVGVDHLPDETERSLSSDAAHFLMKTSIAAGLGRAEPRVRAFYDAPGTSSLRMRPDLRQPECKSQVRGRETAGGSCAIGRPERQPSNQRPDEAGSMAGGGSRRPSFAKCLLALSTT